MTVYRLTDLDHTIAPVHTATASQWDALAAALPQFYGHDVYLNNLGENVSDKYPPTLVGQLIQQGAVWIDWCGWPFWDYGSTAFQELMSLLGIQATPDFNMADIGDKVPGTTFERSLILPAQLLQPAVYNHNAPHGTAQKMNAGIIAVGQRYWYSSFAILYGKGAYIYAYGNDSSYGLFGVGGYNTGVPLSQYNPFILEVLSNLPQPSPNPVPGPPSCPYYGQYYGPGQTAGTYVFTKQYSGYFEAYVVDQNCKLLGGPYYHSTNPTPPTGGSSGGTTSGGSGGTPTSGTGTNSGGGNTGGSGGSVQSPPPTTSSGTNGALIAAAVAAGAFYLLRGMRG